MTTMLICEKNKLMDEIGEGKKLWIGREIENIFPTFSLLNN